MTLEAKGPDYHPDPREGLNLRTLFIDNPYIMRHYTQSFEQAKGAENAKPIPKDLNPFFSLGG